MEQTFSQLTKVCVFVLRSAVWAAWEVHGGQPLQQEEGGDVHHHGGSVHVRLRVSGSGPGRLDRTRCRPNICSAVPQLVWVGLKVDDDDDGISVFSFLGSLRARLKQLHPSANCSLRDDHMVHVHFKEEIGVAELIPLVTTYIILFAYIYFSTRESF